MAAGFDYVLTVSATAARAATAHMSLRLLEPPLPLAPYALNLLWHPRLDNEPANQWLREVFVRAAGGDAAGARRGRGRSWTGSRRP